MGTKITHISSQSFSLISHIILLTFLLSATVVVPELIPEDVKYTSIGTQTFSPVELAMSGTKDANDTDTYSPSGSKNPSTQPENQTNNSDWILPDKPVASEESSNPKEGLPGDPVPATKPSDGTTEVTKPAEQGVDSEGIPELYGFPLRGKTVFLLDVSGSMDSRYKNTTRLEAMKVSLINYIKLMVEEDEFDIVIFADGVDEFGRYYKYLWGSLSKATSENKAEAIKWLKKVESYGSTPTYEALQYVCTHYNKDLNNLLLITDGYPNEEEPIIREAPEWFKKFDHCALICISIGGEGYAFITKLAHAVNGAFAMIE